MIKKILLGVVVLLIAFVVVVAVAKDAIIKYAVTEGVKAVTGLTLQIDSLQIGFQKTLVGINGLKLFNPKGFEDKLMIDLPEIFVQYDLPALLKKEVHLQVVRLNLESFTVVKNKEGKLNLDALKPVQTAKEEKPAPEQKPQPEEKAAMPPLKIDLLELKIGTVYYKDYSVGPQPSVREFKVNINERHENITDPQELVKIIVTKALAKTTIANLTNFDIAGLKGSLGGALKGAGGLTVGTGKEVEKTTVEAVKETTDALKNLLPFGKKEQK